MREDRRKHRDASCGFRRRWAVVGGGLFLAAAFSFYLVSSQSPPLALFAKGGDDSPPQRVEFQRIASELYQSDNLFLGREAYDQLRRDLENPNLPLFERLYTRLRLSLEMLRFGEEQKAVHEIEAVLEVARDDPHLGSLLQTIYPVRGLAYLRLAEVENCIRRHHPDRCIFPLRGGSLHEVAAPAKRAFESYLEALKHRPHDLKLRWLLNLTAMALDRYPKHVPEQFLIPPTVFESDQLFPRLVDHAPQLGLDDFNLAGGVIVGDFNGSGLLDIITTSYDPREPVRFYRNKGDGSFEDSSADSRLNEQFGGLNLIGADFNNSGAMDLFILRGAWLLDHGRIRNSLLRNDGEGRFTDITRLAGLSAPAMPTQTAAFGDFNNDGLLDLYVGNESRVEVEQGSGDFPSQLFRNNGDQTFIDIAAKAGVTNDRFTKGVAAGDFNNDGHLDLYVSNLGANRLYRNNGDGSFTDVAPELGVDEPAGRSFACWFFDYNNDGWLDIFVVGYDARIEEVAADYLGKPHSATVPALYRNNGDGSFTNVAKETGLSHAWLPMGANFGDIDGDGWLDIYLGTGDPDFQTILPNIVLRNDQGKRFRDITTASGLGHLQKGHGIAFADFNQNGRQDIFHQLGGFYPGDKFNNVFFVNPHPLEGMSANRFLMVQLVGTRSNRSAIGARLSVTIDSPHGGRTVHRAVGSVSSFGGSPLRQEIGLGRATRIRSVDVWWPRSDIRQTFTDVPLDAFIRVTEGRKRFERFPYEPFEYGVSGRAAIEHELPNLPRFSESLLLSFQPAVRRQIGSALKAARDKPQDAALVGHLGMVLHAYDKFALAESCYARAHYLDPTVPKWLYYLGLVKQKLGEEEAAAFFRRFLQKEPEFTVARLRLARALLSAGDLDESRQVYQQVLDQEPDLGVAYYELGEVHAASGETDSAVENYRRAVELAPDLGAAYYALALAQRDSGRIPEAQEYFNLYQANRDGQARLPDPLLDAVRLLALGASVHFSRGYRLEGEGRLEEAAAAYEQTLERDPRFGEAHVNLIFVYTRLGRFEEAEKHYRQGLEVNPRLSDLHYNYGLLLAERGQFSDAVTAFAKALDLNPYSAQAHNNRGSLLEREGKFEEAKRHFRLAVQHDPAHRLARFNLGLMLVQEGRHEEAIRHFLKTLSARDENTPTFLYELANAYAGAGDLERGLEFLKRAIREARSFEQHELAAQMERDLAELRQRIP